MRSASTQFLIPAVLRVRMYVSAKEARTGRLTLSRRNIMLRDKCTCQCAPMPRHSRDRGFAERFSPLGSQLLCTHAEQHVEVLGPRQTVTVWSRG